MPASLAGPVTAERIGPAEKRRRTAGAIESAGAQLRGASSRKRSTAPYWRPRAWTNTPAKSFTGICSAIIVMRTLKLDGICTKLNSRFANSGPRSRRRH